jgi:hypothetical protein
VGFGQHGGAISTTVVDYSAAFKAIGLEDYVDFEADLAAAGFDDVKARATQGLLRSMMIQEERLLLGGNTSLALGTTPTPTLAASASGGTLGTMTLSVICVALTLEGVLNSSVAAGIPGQVSRTNMDATTSTYGGGSAQKSANATVSVTGSTGSATATVAAVTGALGYAWYWGTAGNEALGAITTINSVSITANAAGTQLASAITNGGADNSTNNLVFDGIITQCLKGLGSYVYKMATGTAGVGTPLTATGDGSVAEIDAALKSFWDLYRLSPDTIWVSSQEMTNIGKKILQGNSTAAQRFVFEAKQGMLAGGYMVTGYLNRYSMDGVREIPVKLHPNLPAGTILFTSSQIPYPLSNVTDVLKVKGRRDYYQLEWPIRTRRWEYGVYSDEVLQNYFPPAFGVITNIANG